MIDRLNVMLADLSISLDHLYHVDLREAVRREDFVDELHLHSLAAVRVAGEFDSVIQRVIGRQRSTESWTQPLALGSPSRAATAREARAATISTGGG